MLTNLECALATMAILSTDELREALKRIEERRHASISAAPPNGTTTERPDMLDAAEPVYVGSHFILYADRPDVGASPEVQFKGDDVPEVFKDYVGREIAFWANGSAYPYVQWAPVDAKFPHMGTVRVERPQAVGRGRTDNVRPLLVLPEAKAEELIRGFTNLKASREAHRKEVREAYDTRAKNLFAHFGGKL